MLCSREEGYLDKLHFKIVALNSYTQQRGEGTTCQTHRSETITQKKDKMSNFENLEFISRCKTISFQQKCEQFLVNNRLSMFLTVLYSQKCQMCTFVSNPNVTSAPPLCVINP